MQQETATARVRPFSEMPRAPGHPLLGSLPDWMGVAKAKTTLQRLMLYARERGPVVRVPLGPTSIVSVTDVELAAELLTGDDANYKGWTYILTRAVLDNVLLLNGAPWEHHRKLYRTALRGVDALAAADACADEFVAGLLAGPRGRAIDLGVAGRTLAGDAVGRFVAGTSLGPELEPHRARIQYELAAIGMDLQCQPWAYLSPRRWISLRDSVARTRAFFRGVVAARRGGPEPAARDVLSGLFALAAEGALPDDDAALAEPLVNIFFTAHDVLSASLSFCLWLLAAHPEVQSRLRDELRALGPGALTGDALADADYLSMVVKEALRLYPGYSLFGRNPQRPMTLAGYRVPRSALIIVSPLVIHRLERYFPAPERFDPERWRGRPGPPPPRPEGGYMPFGAGQRGCLASRLAFPVMKQLVARTVRDLELRAEPGHTPRLAYWGTCYAENGLWARVSPAPA